MLIWRQSISPKSSIWVFPFFSDHDHDHDAGSWGGSSTEHGFSLFWCLVPFPVLCSPCVQGIKRKINSTNLLKVLWHLIFASSVCRRRFLIHISNLKENITLATLLLFNHREQNPQEGWLQAMKKPDVTEDIWNRSFLFLKVWKFILRHSVQHHWGEVFREGRPCCSFSSSNKDIWFNCITQFPPRDYSIVI